MILNSSQLRKAREELAKLRAVQRKVISMNSSFGVADASYTLMLDEQIECMEAEIKEFELLRSSVFAATETLFVARTLPECLIKGRIAIGWSAEDLSRRTSIQNIDRHEKNDYKVTKLGMLWPLQMFWLLLLNNEMQAFAGGMLMHQQSPCKTIRSDFLLRRGFRCRAPRIRCKCSCLVRQLVSGPRTPFFHRKNSGAAN